jgi:hypothetical protein
MEPKAKLTKEMICEEARFILANVLAEGRYGKQNRYDDIRRICEGAVSLGLPDYITFLETFGYLTYDRATDVLDVTSEGERVVSGEKTQDLMARVLQHFMAKQPLPTAQPARRPRFIAASSPPPAASTGAPAAGVAGGAAPPASLDADELPTIGPERIERTERPVGTAATSPGSAREILDRRYEKISRIGSGGIGTVWKARQITLDREVAVKEMRELFSFFTEEQRREIIRRFGEVVRQAARLSHPNINPLLDVNSEREHPYMVSELAPHGNLRRIIQHAEDLPVPLAIKYFLQSLHALRAAHDLGITHRGLKPENILLDRYGNARVSDFGNARIVERDQAVIQQVYVGMGTVTYLAPELFTDPTATGPQADLYALGIVLYELLTRKIPGRRSPMPSEVVTGLPRSIDDIFDRLTRDSREERYRNAEEVLDHFYGAADIGELADLKGSILFFKSPLETLTFRDTPTRVEPPEEAAPTVVTPSAVEPAAAATPPAAAPGEDAAAPASETGRTEGSGARALGRRPYSFQQRVKERDKE